MSNLKLKLLLLTALALFVSSAGTAYAYDGSRSYNKHSSASYSNKYSKTSKASYKTNRYAHSNVRSRSDVMREVKERYNAKVLKISLNEKSGVYNVRVLMPNGKVRSLQVIARG